MIRNNRLYHPISIFFLLVVRTIYTIKRNAMLVKRQKPCDVIGFCAFHSTCARVPSFSPAAYKEVYIMPLKCVVLYIGCDAMVNNVKYILCNMFWGRGQIITYKMHIKNEISNYYSWMQLESFFLCWFCVLMKIFFLVVVCFMQFMYRYTNYTMWYF